jgi:signal transduction histidine kinase/DNA-binding NarL/FixJ family response regulator
MLDHSARSEAPVLLLLEDNPSDALLIEDALSRALPQARVVQATTCREYLDQLAGGPIDLVLSDGSVLGCEGVDAFHRAREVDPQIALILISCSDRPRDRRELRGLGISDYRSKNELAELGPAVRRALEQPGQDFDPAQLLAGHELLHTRAAALTEAVDRPAVMTLVQATARRLTGADATSFVLRAGSECDYADEQAGPGAEPLGLKGRRLPLTDCIAGWALRQHQPAVVDEVSRDSRFNSSLYGPSVASLAVVPVRAADPIAAIGCYWAQPHLVTATEVRLLQLLADLTAVALTALEARQALQAIAQERQDELDGFSYAISHDLRAPIRHLDGFTRILLMDADPLSPEAQHTAGRIRDAAGQLREMVDGLLVLSRTSRAEVNRQPMDLAELARQVAATLSIDEERAGPVEFVAPDRLPVQADPQLLQVAVRHLLTNAWKFTARIPRPRVELGLEPSARPSDPPVYFVRDNGAGFEPKLADRLFGAFQRLHSAEDFPGTGMGLATTQRIIAKHGGRIRATAVPDHGATFTFTLPDPSSP